MDTGVERLKLTSYINMSRGMCWKKDVAVCVNEVASAGL
jgi:hypothetical protein